MRVYIQCGSQETWYKIPLQQLVHQSRLISEGGQTVQQSMSLFFSFGFRKILFIKRDKILKSVCLFEFSEATSCEA